LAIFYIDAGHGGAETGATRTYNNVQYSEKDFNLQLALLVKRFLQTISPQQTIYLYRETDKNGNRYMRGQDAKSKGADIFISIHNNSASNTSASGTLTLYPKTFTLGWETSKNFASYMQGTVISYMNSKGWGVTDNGISIWTNSDSELGVFQGAAPIPSCLVECAFMSNNKDIEKLLNQGFLEDMAYSISLGAVRWLNKYKGLNISEPKRIEEAMIEKSSLLPVLGIALIAIVSYYVFKGGFKK